MEAARPGTHSLLERPLQMGVGGYPYSFEGSEYSAVGFGNFAARQDQTEGSLAVAGEEAEEG